LGPNLERGPGLSPNRPYVKMALGKLSNKILLRSHFTIKHLKMWPNLKILNKILPTSKKMPGQPIILWHKTGEVKLPCAVPVIAG
jgi:hypothetical protein